VTQTTWISFTDDTVESAPRRFNYVSLLTSDNCILMCVLVWVFPAFYMFLWSVCFCMLLKVELIKSRPNKTGLNVRVHTSVYVRPSAKRFPIWTKFGTEVGDDDKCYTTTCRMTRSKIKVKVTEVRKLRKWPISKSILCRYACTQKTNGKLW